MRQTKLALHSATVGDTTYRGWGIAGPMSNIQHSHDNRTTVAGSQFNVSSSGSVINDFDHHFHINLNTIGLLIRPLLSSFSSPEPFKR